jgi:hypothetical protein
MFEKLTESCGASGGSFQILGPNGKYEIVRTGIKGSLSQELPVKNLNGEVIGEVILFVESYVEPKMNISEIGIKILDICFDYKILAYLDIKKRKLCELQFET